MGQAARRIDCNGVSAMLCKFSMLRRKEVINLCDGSRLGFVGDLDIQVPEGTVKGIIVFGPCRFSVCSDAARISTFHGTASESSGMTSSSSTSRSRSGSHRRPAGKGVVRVKNSASGMTGDAVFSYFLKLSFRDTLRSNTRCSAVQSRLSMQK